MLTVHQYFDLLLLTLNSVGALIVLGTMAFSLSFTLGGLITGFANVLAAWFLVRSLKESGFFK